AHPTKMPAATARQNGAPKTASAADGRSVMIRDKSISPARDDHGPATPVDSFVVPTPQVCAEGRVCSLALPSRHCEERQRRSNPASRASELDCFAAARNDDVKDRSRGAIAPELCQPPLRQEKSPPTTHDPKSMPSDLIRWVASGFRTRSRAEKGRRSAERRMPTMS